MTLALTIFWIIIVSSFTLLAAFYAKRSGRPDALVALYVTLVLFANIAASKTVGFNLGFTTIFAPATVIIFAVTFLLAGIVNERFGKKEVQRMILIAVFCQIAVILFSVLILKATPAPFFSNQPAFDAVLGLVPRIVIASLAAFFISENTDAYLFHGLRKLTNNKHLWIRGAFSSLPAMIIDSCIFITLAFYGIMPIIPLIIGQTIIKWLIGIVDIPFMYLARRILGKVFLSANNEIKTNVI